MRGGGVGSKFGVEAIIPKNLQRALIWFVVGFGCLSFLHQHQRALLQDNIGMNIYLRIGLVLLFC